MKFSHPLMENNIDKDDLDILIRYLKKPNSRLTQGQNVIKFEKLWSKWLGVKYSIFVNSGSSANLLSLTCLRLQKGEGEIIVSPLNWVSDISAIIQNNFKPVFVDIDPKTMCLDTEEVIKKINRNTKGVLLSHIQGFNGLNEKLLNCLNKKSIPLIEDVCESHGAKFKNKKLGSFGNMSNFSFYYAHHMSTIEGGMICTNDKATYLILRMLRAHGLLRESNDKEFISKNIKKYQNLNKDFIFMYPAYNVRSTELNAIIGINQLKKLDKNIKIRNQNHKLFLNNLNKEIYFTEFNLKGSSNYALNLILKKPNKKLFEKIKKILNKNKIEFRQGSAGGGNQLRQPYLYNYIRKNFHKKFKNTEHIHEYGMYIGNYPNLSNRKIIQLCSLLNSVI